jgi:uncharacterized membrane protein YqhA
MIKKLLLVRYMFLIVVVFMMLSSIAFIVGGVLECFDGFRTLYEYGLDEEKRPGMKLLKGLDLFLVSMVFMIIALGILRVFGFAGQFKGDTEQWMDMNAFRELKVLIWETILVTMVVFTLTFIASSKVFHFEMLILPGSVLLLSLALFVMRKH